MNRQEKEDLYIAQMTELWLRCQRPLNGDWDFVKKWSDKELDQRIKDTIVQVGEKSWDSIAKSSVSALIIGFVLLGVAGLLLSRIESLSMTSLRFAQKFCLAK